MLSLFDLRRSKGVCSNCFRQYLSRTSIERSNKQRKKNDASTRKPLIYVPTETNLPSSISSLNRSKEKTLKIFQYTAEKRHHEILHFESCISRTRRSQLLKCYCGCEFSTNTTMYLRSKNSCPDCTRLIISATQNKRLGNELQGPRGRGTQRRSNMRNNTNCTISNKKEMLTLLKNESNPYNDFMVEKILHPTGDDTQIIQKHHIIPLCKGGPHANWNIVNLTKKEHAWAHALRAQTYGDFEDIQALQFFNIHTDLNDANFYEKISEIISSFEAEHPRVRPTFGSSISDIIHKKTIWIHPDLSSPLIVEAGAVNQTTGLKLLFKQHLPLNSQTKDKLTLVSNITFRNRLNRLIKGRGSSMYGFKLLSVE
jgi:hypothetical protein